MRRAIGRFLRVAGGATGAIAGSMSAQAGDELACAIDFAVKGGMAEIRGIATSHTGGQGTYRLVVVKTGSAGTTNVAQGGQVTLEPGGRTGVGYMNLSVEAGARYEAVLTLEVGGARRECRAASETDLKL